MSSLTFSKTRAEANFHPCVIESRFVSDHCCRYVDNALNTVQG